MVEVLLHGRKLLDIASNINILLIYWTLPWIFFSKPKDLMKDFSKVKIYEENK